MPGRLVTFDKQTEVVRKQTESLFAYSINSSWDICI